MAVGVVGQQGEVMSEAMLQRRQQSVVVGVGAVVADDQVGDLSRVLAGSGLQLREYASCRRVLCRACAGCDTGRISDSIVEIGAQRHMG